jgi:putative acetyltransferase
VSVRSEAPADIEAIWTLVRDAFESRAEPDLVDKLRVSGDAVLSLVWVEQGEIVGHILFSRMSLAGVVALGPLAVKPERQSRGIGSALVRAGLDLLRERGEQAVFVLGHRDYYPRFGFRADLAAQFESPYAGDSFFALELQEGALKGLCGAVAHAPAFAIFEE